VLSEVADMGGWPKCRGFDLSPTFEIDQTAAMIFGWPGALVAIHNHAMLRGCC
jgi:hypothetical protein